MDRWGIGACRRCLHRSVNFGWWKKVRLRGRNRTRGRPPSSLDKGDLCWILEWLCLFKALAWLSRWFPRVYIKLSAYDRTTILHQQWAKSGNFIHNVPVYCETTVKVCLFFTCKKSENFRILLDSAPRWSSKTTDEYRVWRGGIWTLCILLGISPIMCKISINQPRRLDVRSDVLLLSSVSHVFVNVHIRLKVKSWNWWWNLVTRWPKPWSTARVWSRRRRRNPTRDSC